MSNKKTESTISIGFTGLLGLLFITLKLTRQIDWDWLWVLSPFWIPFSVVVVVFLVIFLGSMFFALASEWVRK